MYSLASPTRGFRPFESGPAKDELSDTYPKGRRCRDPKCITILCQWNPGPFCYLHAQKIRSRLVAEMMREAA